MPRAVRGSADAAEPLDAGFQHLVAGAAPPVVGEDLDLLRRRGSRRPRSSRGTPGRSMTPSPIMPRSSSRSVVGTSQSQMWWAKIAPMRPARAICAGEVGVPPDVIDVDRDADAAAADRLAMSSACSSVFTQARSAAYIGCSGSIAIGTPAARACGSSAAMPSVTIRAGVGRGPWSRPGRPPTTSTRQSAPSAAASSMARRLSSSACAPALGVRRREDAAAAEAGELAGRSPDDAGGLRRGRSSAIWSRHGQMVVMPWRRQPSTASREAPLPADAWRG